MKEIVTREYQCEVCGKVHADYTLAAKCEATPVDKVKCKVGDIVGVDTHGWWEDDTSWTISQVCGNYFDAKDSKWEVSPPGPFSPSKRAFLPLWKVVATRTRPGEHVTEILLWCARHANCRFQSKTKRYGEKLVWTTSSTHYTPKTIPKKFWPVLTPEEELRFAELVATAPWQESHLL